MTGAEELAQIVAMVEAMIPVEPDRKTHRSICCINMSGAILQRAAALIAESKFDVACDLVSLGSVFAIESWKDVIEERQRDGKYSLAESLRRMQEGGSLSNTRLIRNEPDRNAIPAEELVELGVINDVSQIEPGEKYLLSDFQFMGIVGYGENPKCVSCDRQAVCSWFGILADDHSVGGNAVCEEHMKELVEGLHDDPYMKQVAQVLFIRRWDFVPEAEAEDDDDEDDDEDDDDEEVAAMS